MIKKTVFILLLFSLMSFYKNGSTVFICGSTGANKYHYSNTCRGLNACKHTIVEVSREKAKLLGLTLCGWED